MAAPSRARRTFAALAVRNYRWYLGAQTLSQIGTWFQMLAQVWLVAELTGSGIALGLTTALQALPVLLLASYGGVLADRHGARRILLVTQLALASVALGLALLAATDQLTVQWIYLGAFLAGTVNAFDRPAAQAFLYELVGPEHLGSAVALNSVQMSSGRLVGPAFAGLLLAWVGAAACFFVNATSFLLVVVALLVIRQSELIPRVRSTRAKARIIEGIRYVRGIPELRRPLLASAIVGCLAFNFVTVMAAMVQFEFDAGSEALGAVESLNAAFAVLGGLFIAGVRRPSIRFLGGVCLAFSAAMALNSLAPTLGWYLAAMPFFGFTVACFSATAQTVVQRNAAPEMQGRVAALYTLAIQGTSPVGALLAGLLIDVSPRAAMGMGAVGALVSGVMLLVVTSGRRNPAAPAVGDPAIDLSADPAPVAAGAGAG